MCRCAIPVWSTSRNLVVYSKWIAETFGEKLVSSICEHFDNNFQIKVVSCVRNVLKISVGLCTPPSINIPYGKGKGQSDNFYWLIKLNGMCRCCNKSLPKVWVHCRA